jgi:chromosomal replication initiation ATPase DnaA
MIMKAEKFKCDWAETPMERDFILRSIRAIPERLGITPEMISRHVVSVDRRAAVQLDAAARSRCYRQSKHVAIVVIKPLPKGLPEDSEMTPAARAVAAVFGLDWRRLFERGRPVDVVAVRQVAMALLMEQGRWRLGAVARYFGKKDHNTVAHACRTVMDRSETDAEFRSKVERSRAAVADHVSKQPMSYQNKIK